MGSYQNIRVEKVVDSSNDSGKERLHLDKLHVPQQELYATST